MIDEAHSSQGGKTSAAMSQVLGAAAEDEDAGPDPEDTVNEAVERRMAARKMLTNASYFAFTATPKNKTLEMFGEPLPADAEGKVKHRPFRNYTMKQAVEECFILDVLKSYTPVDSYYKLVKKTEADPEFDTKKARKKLRRYVESHDHAIRLKAEIMVDHFHEQVLAAGKIGGQARAMVVTSGIERAIFVVPVDRAAAYARLRRHFVGSPLVEVVMDRRGIVMDRRVGPLSYGGRSSAVERRRTQRRETPAPSSAVRPTSRGEDYAVYEATAPLSVRCPECGLMVMVELPRFAEPPVRLELTVIHEVTPHGLHRHVVEAQSLSATGRVLFTSHLRARPLKAS